MIRKIALIASLGLFVAVFTVNAQTAGTTQPQPGSSMDTADTTNLSKDFKFSGKVDKIDTLAKTIAVKIDKTGEVKVFTYDDKTTYWSKDDKSIKFDTLKVGSRVGVESDAANLAIKIRIKPADMNKDMDTDDPDADDADKE